MTAPLQPKLIGAIISIWYRGEEITKTCDKLVQSMPTRIRQVTKNKGSHINY